MKEYFHIDLSTKFAKRGTTGIAYLALPSKEHKGCALKGRMKRYFERRLCFGRNLKKNYAKLYAICIYYLIKDKLELINKLVICNDEEFVYVKKYLEVLLGTLKNNIEIISINEFRKQFSRKVQSPADNYARHYAKRGLNKNKWNKGIKLSVVEITFFMIKKKWEELKNVSE